jgi:hypothetical protein
MGRILTYGTLIAALTIVLLPAEAAHAGNGVLNGARGPSPSGNLQGGQGGGCKGPACNVKGPTASGNKKYCVRLGRHGYPVCK